ncbi:MAG: hypothetical protein ACOCVR_01300 [Myxococcota bacterium]
MNLVIDTGVHQPTDAVRRRILEHAQHLAHYTDDIEECRVRIIPVGSNPAHPSGYMARIDIVTPEGRMVIGDHAGWPHSDKPGVAVDMSFRRAFEVVRQHGRQRRGEVREHRTAEHDEPKVHVSSEPGAAATHPERF